MSHLIWSLYVAQLYIQFFYYSKFIRFKTYTVQSVYSSKFTWLFLIQFIEFTLLKKAVISIGFKEPILCELFIWSLTLYLKDSLLSVIQLLSAR
jgi:hypothetical protein